MKVWSALFNMFAIILIAVMLISVRNIEITNQRQFEQVRLSYAVDYATEAAFRSAISSDSLSTDYADGGLMESQVNLSQILPTFYNILAMSYDLSLSEENFIKIENSIATGFVAATNGYYILESQEVDSNPYDYQIGGEHRLLWGMKRPYLVYTKCPKCDKPRLFAANLVNKKNTEYIPENGYDRKCNSCYPRESVTEPFMDRNNYEDTGLTPELVKYSISKNITEDINYAIHKRNLEDINGKINAFYVPTAESMTAVKNLTKPSLAIIFQDSTFLNGYNMDVVSIGGVQVKPKSQVITFEVLDENGNPTDGVIYYCFAGQQFGDNFTTGSKRKKPKIEIHETFKSIHEAASKGYSPHFEFLREPYVGLANKDKK